MWKSITNEAVERKSIDLTNARVGD